jgi:polar amino acid transport system substrate-binding protein
MRLNSLNKTIIGFVCLLFAVSVNAIELPKEIQICDNGNEWPPYTFYKRVDGRVTSELTGFSVEYIQTILKRAGLKPAITMLPWLRCQSMVTIGKYLMLLNASENAERARDYLVSKPYYAVQGIYIYSTTRPKPRIQTARDLLLRHTCGQMGYNYVNFGIRNEEIDSGTTTLPMTLEKLKFGNCDVVLARKEIAAGHIWINGIDYTNDKNFGWGILEGMKPSQFHMMVSRQTPYAQQLIELIDNGIDDMTASGEAKKLEKKYLPKSASE